MVATLSLVEAAQPSLLSDAARVLHDKAEAMATWIRAQQRDVATLRNTWRGSTADSALAKALAEVGRQQALAATLNSHGSALRFGGINLTPLRTQIVAMASQARMLGGTVSDDGTVVGNRPAGVMTPTLAAAYTASLTSMLSLFTRVDETVADALRAGAPAPQTPPPDRRWTGADLYRGDPAGADVNQDGIGDCYLVATMSAIAHADPQWIRDRIAYDPQTGDFDVTLWDGSQWRHIPVTQADVDANIAAGGASGVDSAGGADRDAPLWPAVLESAYATMKAPGQGVAGIQKGVTPPALEALTGNNGEWIVPATEWLTPSQHIDTRIADALNGHQPVMLSTSLFTGDVAGLSAQHVYSVESISGTGSDATVTLRNPWGPDDGPPVIQARLGELIGTGPLGGLGLGPTAMINIGRMGS